MASPVDLYCEHSVSVPTVTKSCMSFNEPLAIKPLDFQI